MRQRYLSESEAFGAIQHQIFAFEKGLSRRQLSIQDVGYMVPGSVMLHELSGNGCRTVAYINDWGCQQLGASLDEIKSMGNQYYEHFFDPEEFRIIMPGVRAYCMQPEHPLPYNYFQRVKTIHSPDLVWHYTSFKILSDGSSSEKLRLLVVASPLAGLGNMVCQVSNALEDHAFIAQHYRKYAMLSKREKEIIRLLCEGKSSSVIAEQLFISKLTVDTHRKNICRKLEVDSFARLVRFAVAFELC